MNAFISSAGFAPLAETIPEKTAEVLIGDAWIDVAAHLHKAICEELSAEQKHFLVRKERSFFEGLLLQKTGKFIGGLYNHALVSMAGVVFADTFSHAVKAGALTYPDQEGALSHLFGEGKVAVIQSLCVQASYTKGGFCPLMLDAIIQVATADCCTHVFAQVAEDNVKGKSKLEARGFTSVARWTNGHTRHLMAKAVEAKTPVLHLV